MVGNNLQSNNQNSVGQNSQQGAGFVNGNQGGSNTQSGGQNNIQVGGNIIGNDTAVTGSGGVVSLKGGQTQSEVDEQKRIDELKSGAVKLERKLTLKEIELEKMHKAAVKPAVFMVSQAGCLSRMSQSEQVKGQLFENAQGNNVSLNSEDISNFSGGVKSAVEKNNTVKQAEQVENMINPPEKKVKEVEKVKKQFVNNVEKEKGKNEKEAEKKELVEESPKVETGKVIVAERNDKCGQESNPPQAGQQTGKVKKRMVISPSGKISYDEQSPTSRVQNLVVDEQEIVDNEEVGGKKIEKDRDIGDGKNNKENQVNLRGGKNNNIPKTSFGGGIVDLKSKKDDDVGSQINGVDNGELVIEKKIKQELKIPETPWEKNKVDLKRLTPAKRLDMQATPSVASVRFDMDEDLNGEVVGWFNKYNELPVNIKLGLGSSEVRQKIKEIAGKNNLMNEGNLGEISRIVREVYVGLIKGKDIRKRLTLILKLKKTKIEDIMEDIASVVALIKDIGNKKSEEYFEKLSLKDVLEKYINISEQEVTTGMIVNKKTGKYIDPTIRNWIDDYINQFGSGGHTNLERGKYLDDSINTKNLDSEDKKNVGKLAKSYDEGSKLIIDREEKIILWNLHDNESQLGINSDRNKRVINKFKIEEAQAVDVDNDGLEMSVNTNDKGNDKGKRLADSELNLGTYRLGTEGNKIKSEQPVGAMTTQNNNQNDEQGNKMKSDLENKGGDSIIKGSQENKNNDKSKKEKNGEELLDLSSEISVN